MLKQHGGHTATSNSKAIRTNKATETAQQRLADLSFSRFMRGPNRQQVSLITVWGHYDGKFVPFSGLMSHDLFLLTLWPLGDGEFLIYEG